MGSIDSILLTHAELAIALAGFASVAAVLRRPLAPVQRQRFFAILFPWLFQILASILSLWLAELELAGPALWRTASALQLALALPIAVFVLLPLRQLGARSFLVINRPITSIGYGLLAALFALLVVNLLVSASSFALYYAALLTGLVTIFLAFADVVVVGHDEP